MQILDYQAGERLILAPDTGDLDDDVTTELSEDGEDTLVLYQDRVMVRLVGVTSSIWMTSTFSPRT